MLLHGLESGYQSYCLRQVKSRGKGGGVRWIVRIFRGEGNDKMEERRTVLKDGTVDGMDSR